MRNTFNFIRKTYKCKMSCGSSRHNVLLHSIWFYSGKSQSSVVTKRSLVGGVANPISEASLIGDKKES